MTGHWPIPGAFRPFKGPQQLPIDFFSSQNPQHSQADTRDFQRSCPTMSPAGDDYNGNTWNQWMPEGLLNNTTYNNSLGDAPPLAWPYDEIGKATMACTSNNELSGIDPRQLEASGVSGTNEEHLRTSWDQPCTGSKLPSKSPEKPSDCVSQASYMLDFDNSDCVSSASEFQQSTSNSPMPGLEHPSSSNDRNLIEEDASEANEPYNKLLFRCLKSAPHHELQLKDIYNWFRVNTSKGRIPNQKGWQNSIRHNLSMNKAFRRGSRINPGTGMKNMWHLNSEFFDEVEPTTRFRNEGNKKSSAKLKCLRRPAPQRQASGSRGGRAARRFARDRQNVSPSQFRLPQSPHVTSQMPKALPRTIAYDRVPLFQDSCRYGPFNHTKQPSSSNVHPEDFSLQGRSPVDVQNRKTSYPSTFTANGILAQTTDFSGMPKSSLCGRTSLNFGRQHEHRLDSRGCFVSTCKPLPEATSAPSNICFHATIDTENINNHSALHLKNTTRDLAGDKSSDASPSSTPSLADIAGVHADSKDRPIFETESEESPNAEPLTPEEAARGFSAKDTCSSVGIGIPFGGWNGNDYFSYQGAEFIE